MWCLGQGVKRTAEAPTFTDNLELNLQLPHAWLAGARLPAVSVVLLLGTARKQAAELLSSADAL
jgi:hypothetical protein